MSWLRRVIARFVGADRYHDQAKAVHARHLRRLLLSKQLEVIERRGSPR